MRKAYRAFALLLVLVLLSSALVGCRANKVYGHCELTLELPESFEDYDAGETYDVAYSDGIVTVGFLRLSYEVCVTEGIPTTMSPGKFAEYYRTLALDGITVGETKNEGDVPYYTYVLASGDGVSFTYMPTFYFTPYAYFIVTYILPTAVFERELPAILGYTQTMRIVYPE